MQSLSVEVLLPDGSAVRVEVGPDTLVKEVVEDATQNYSLSVDDVVITFEGNIMNPQSEVVSHGVCDGCEFIISLTERSQAISRVGKKPSKEAAREAFERDDPNLIDYFLAGLDVNQPLSGTRPPLWMAVSQNKLKTVEWLVKLKGIDLNRSGHRTFCLTPLMQSITQGFSQISELLIREGANLSARNCDSETALYVAAWYGDVPITKLLIEFGAELNTTESHGQSPLHAAVTKNHPEIVELLLAAGVSPKYGANRSTLPIAVASRNTSIVQLLLSNDAVVDYVMPDRPMRETSLFIAVRGDHVSMVELLLQNGSSVNLANSLSETPLHVACGCSSIDVCKLLLRNGANINKTDCRRNTPLMQACSHNSDIEVAKLLISSGASVTARNKHLETALHMAAQRGLSSIVTILLTAGADPKLSDSYGCTPFDNALNAGFSDTSDLLPKHVKKCCIQ
eukprot:TRINITY_DN1215_c2_g1_i1.p1 TRINITY_DN1215_c2_g1~~TRINITY_DN1215_c2_g1_i1.p1  ORF type:complete len:453 (+),score=78.83 TRINITY_DN1215_c2_g1_i1:96-1454(+)